MNEITGNYWDYVKDADILVVPTNGVVKSNGKLVMGAGIAKGFRDRYKGLDQFFGGKLLLDQELICKEHLVLQNVHYYGILTTASSKINLDFDKEVIALQTKGHWNSTSDYDLIEWSVGKLWAYLSGTDKKVLMTRPGCGLGSLVWDASDRAEKGVKDRISFLDERFTVVNYDNK